MNLTIKTALTTCLAILLSLPAVALELATTIERTDTGATLVSDHALKLSLIKISSDVRGQITVTGKATVKGGANLTLWAKVDNNYYFSKMPELQGLTDTNNHAFSIPFNSPDQAITEVVLEVELIDGGSVAISEVAINNN